MEFNWADPRKNRRVDTVMMAKAEASRVKRLTSVKSTVSNQLNPAVEHKLKTLKKKKTSEHPDERPSSRLHQREFDCGNNNNQTQRSGSGNNHSFYNEFLPQAARPKSIFDSFDVHAAADGLFHPASNVQAFAEHDARYPAARDHDSSRSSTKGSDLEKRLPPLSGKSDRSDRLASRSDSRLPTASSSSQSHRSLTGLTANRSDGDLHAPRRVGIVPSSADRNAMELLEELENDNSYGHHDSCEIDCEPQDPSPQPSKQQKLKRSVVPVAKRDNNREHHGVPPLELDITEKFEKLKMLMKTNREKEEAAPTGAISIDTKPQQGPEVEEDIDMKPAAILSKKVKEAKSNKPAKDKTTTVADTRSQGVGPGSATMVQASGVDKVSPLHKSTNELKVVVRKPKAKPPSEVKIRNGVSLSALKEEHRAALAMLQELGGPLNEAEDGPQKKKASHHPRVPAVAVSTKDCAHGKVDRIATRPSGSADHSSRLVEKLRARIPSGRDKNSPRNNEETTTTAGANTLHGKDLVSAALDAARVALEKKETQHARREDEPHKDDQNEEDERLWKRYGGDAQDAVDDETEDPGDDLYDDEYFEG